MICELLFPSSVLAVKLNRKSLAIELEMEIYTISLKRVYFMLLRLRRLSKLMFLSILNASPGTVIRVWSIPGAEKPYQFRRGTREARIYSMNFNLVSSLLAQRQRTMVKHQIRLSRQASPPESVEGASPPPSLEGSLNHSSKETEQEYLVEFQSQIATAN
ncbi:hypothetical protein BYT27DRAFT_7254382 [Phlegmacium glaucopus]|nr:hypothetical protein BYT27DRAFT_7254382 [Phlegmacium glaucopus]